MWVAIGRQLEERGKPLLEMTPDELVQAYMSPLTLGVYLSFFLYGVFLLALFLYLVQFRRDTWVNKTVVILLACLTTFDTVSGGIRIFRMTVLNPNNLAYVLDKTQRPEDWLCTLALLCTILLCQAFMCFRIMSFARHMADWTGPGAVVKIWTMGGALGLGWLVCFGLAVANCVVFYMTDNYIQLLIPSYTAAKAFRVTTLVLPCVLLAMDILIAVIMSMQYRKAKTGFGASDHILQTLITTVVRNGILVALVMTVQFIVTYTAVLWGNMLPLSYGKLHALTVLCILTEPRLAQSRWHRDQESSRPAASQPPHMDYTRPSQLSTGTIAGQAQGGRRRRRRHSDSSGSVRPHLELPFDGSGADDWISGPGSRSGQKSSGGNNDTASSAGTGSSGEPIRPGMMGRKISEAPTASTAAMLETPVYELKEGDIMGMEGEGQERGGLLVVVSKEDVDGDRVFSFVEALKETDEKEDRGR